ncbi:MAG: O-methyltransferase [Mangrovibacterium sp.]
MRTDRELERYIQDHSNAEDELLRELDRETHLRVVHPRMLSGHLQGHLLEMISRMIRPARILEIGTYTGYSAICLARGLKTGGRLHTIEINDELAPMAQSYFERAGLGGSIIPHTGDALEIIPTLKENFDLVFLDANKRQYPLFYDMILQKLKAGGFLLADNVLWGGKVVQTLNDKQSAGILEFNEKVKKDPRVSQLILPIRDGLMLIRKKDEPIL